MIRAYIISAVRLYRDGLTRVFDSEPAFAVSGASADARAALGELRDERLQTDVVLLDLAAPDALHQARTLCAMVPALPVVAIGVSNTDDELRAWAATGAAGFVTRDDTLEDLMRAAETVARGAARCPRRMLEALVRGNGAPAPAPDPLSDLTKREREIVGLLGDGLTNKQIATRLHIEVPTVKNHVHRTLGKLKVKGRSDVADVVRSRAGS